MANTVVYLLLTVWALIVLFPFYWMLLTSVKPYSTYNAEYIPKFYTLSPTLENYADAFTAVPLGRYFLNTLFFTVVTTAVMLAVIVPAAFAFARLNFRGKNLVFTLFLSLMMIPNELVRHHQLHDHHQSRPAQYLHWADSAISCVSFLYLPAQGKFCPGSR